MKAIGYLCHNTQDHGQMAVSLCEQEASIRTWADQNRAGEVIIFQDAGSSEKCLEDRPGLQAALNTVDAGDALVCYSLLCLAHGPLGSVASSSTADVLTIVSTLRKKRAKLVSLSEDADKAIFEMYGSVFRFFGFPWDEAPPINHNEHERSLVYWLLLFSVIVSAGFVIGGLCASNMRVVAVGLVTLGTCSGLIWLLLHYGPSLQKQHK